MSQLDFVREIVDDLMDSELADVGTYTAPGGSALPCRVLVTRATAPFGDYGGPIGDSITIKISNADIPAQVSGAVVEVESDALGTEQFRILKKLDDDGALTNWTVERA